MRLQMKMFTILARYPSSNNPSTLVAASVWTQSSTVHEKEQGNKASDMNLLIHVKLNGNIAAIKLEILLLRKLLFLDQTPLISKSIIGQTRYFSSLRHLLHLFD